MMNPLDYSFCDRTVTIYRKEHDRIQRLVVENCYYVWQTVEQNNVQGRRADRLFVLIMPGRPQRVFPGDLVYDGVGPEVQDVDWARFVPAAVEGLSQVAYAHPWYWGGKICHVEAGRK